MQNQLSEKKGFMTFLCKINFVLEHGKTNKMTCAPSEDANQSGRPPSLIRVFAFAIWVAKDPNFLQVDSKGTDQTGLGGCPGWSEPSLGTQVILLDLLYCSSFLSYFTVGRKCSHGLLYFSS